MKDYIITERAGPYVAGRRNPGAGTVLSLTQRAAAHDLRVGALQISRPAPEPEAEPAADEPDVNVAEDPDEAEIARLRDLAEGDGRTTEVREARERLAALGIDHS